MGHSPDYKSYADKPRPKWNWDTKDGEWVGIWGYDWGDLLGKEVTKIDESISFEVWQVDSRADKIYEAEIAPRIIHRNFPAKKKEYWFGLRKRSYWYSDHIINQIAHQDRKRTLLIVPASYDPFRERIVRMFPTYPILHNHFINTVLLLPQQIKTSNPIKIIHYSLRSKVYKRHLKRIKYLRCLKVPEWDDIMRINPEIKLKSCRLGIDLDYWSAAKSKNEARKELNIPEEDFVFVLSQRLVPEYQIDKFLEVVSRLKTTRKFSVYITGHGTPEYQQYLFNLARDFSLTDKVLFIGRVTDDELRDYFIAADLFVTVPIMFGGSNGAKKAMAVGTPILHVTLGSTYYDLKKYNAGVLVSPTNYVQWKKELEEIVDGKKVGKIDRKEVEKLYGWKDIAKQWVDLFNIVIQDKEDELLNHKLD